jgi:methionyl-tRNA formyltransferase
LKIVLLTTDTTHHLHYAAQVHGRFPLSLIVSETQSARAPFDTAHPFEQIREDHEKAVLLQGQTLTLPQIARTLEVERVSDASCLTALSELRPDIMVVFGTGRIPASVIHQVSTACVNLHGGNPEEYRGLDSHLWTIYHRDFCNLTTTLHYVADELDAGDIVFQEQLPLTRRTQLHEIRSINTQLCLDMTLLALTSLATYGKLPRRKQVRGGRYYSFMPAPLKQGCLEKLGAYVGTLQ